MDASMNCDRYYYHDEHYLGIVDGVPRRCPGFHDDSAYSGAVNERETGWTGR